MLLLVAAQHPPRNDRARAVLRHHPIVSLGQELWRQLRAGAEHAHPVSNEQLSQISLVDPRFVGEPQAAPWPTRPGPAPKNVVFVVLESVGNEYLFGGEHLAEDRMPTLARIAQEGVRLSAHRSTANTSPRSIFSLFSGLYDVPTAAIWSIGGEVEVPALFSFLSPEYERFLVTPGRLHSFFPRSFFVNNGMNEMEDKTTIVAKRPSPSGATVDERDGMDSFLARLAQSKRPFFGVYYSYAAHYPYYEYGAEAEAGDVGAKKDDFVRYLSNLKQLDAELRRLLDALATAGHLDDTLLVIVGDHGEAFLQHKGNKGHSRRSFEENLRVPAILWAPQVLLPHVETRTTSHIDITPTVLDVLGLPYERDLFHGESLLGPLKRRVLFTMGNEGVVTSLWGDGTKLALDIHREDCVTYDLTLDPGERHRARCGVGSEREATETWAQLTRRQLTAYNQTTRAHTPYFGLCHSTRCANAVPLATE